MENGLNYRDKDIHCVSFDNYEFCINERKWHLSRDVIINIEWIDQLFSDPIKTGAIKALSFIAQNNSAHHVSNMANRLKRLSSFVYKEKGRLQSLNSADLINFRSSLDKKTEYFLGALAGFLKKWHELGYLGLDNEIPKLLKSWTLRGNEKGLAVKIKDPHRGPLTDFEYEALHQKILDAYEVGDISLNDYVLTTLFMATGRRPAQMADLKGKDFLEIGSSEGLREFILKVPRRKQQGMSWRGEFNPVALIQENGLALRALILKNEARVRKFFPEISEVDLKELPIFPKWKELERFLEQPWDSLGKTIINDTFHSRAQCLSTRQKYVVRSLSVQSERTGYNLDVFPTRLRRTLATRAAREGYGSLVIAELLDHTDDQNARVYTENVPEHVDAINEAVARQLAPIAQAFAGVLVDSHQDASRYGELNRRVRTDSGKAAGTCGHHGFCGALAPISCYTCKFFRAWLDGPHEEVLQVLLQERARVFELTHDDTMAAINDRTIVAVAEVVRRCASRREELTRHG